MATAKMAFDHLLENVLGFDVDEIKSLAQIGVKSYRRLTLMGFEDITDYKDNNKINCYVWRAWTDWRIYTTTNSLSYDETVKLDSATWDKIDFVSLRTAHKLSALNIKLTRTFTAKTVSATDIE